MRGAQPPRNRRERRGALRTERRSLALQPETVAALNEAARLMDAERFDQAAPLLAAILKRVPGQPDALRLDGHLCLRVGDPEAALLRFDKAARRDPTGMAEEDRARTLHALGRWREAMPAYHAAARAMPGRADLWNDCGSVAAAAGMPALPAFRRALALTPGEPSVIGNFAQAAGREGAGEAALDGLRLAVRLNPLAANPQANLALQLRAVGLLAAASGRMAKAIALNPGRFAFWLNLATILNDRGLAEAALEAVEAAERLAPLAPAVARARIAIMPYAASADAAALEAAHRHFAESGAEIRKTQPPLPAPALAKRSEMGRPLRVAYLSSDFRSHSIARALEPVLARHDPKQVVPLLYAEGVAGDSVKDPATDPVTGRFKRLASRWRVTTGLDDRAVAEQVRRDKADILVVLGGRFDQNRPLVAGWRAAPIQIAHHDVATCGLPEMDILLADPVLMPPNAPDWTAERAFRLPSFVHYPPPEGAPAPSERRRDGPFTFGCFNAPSKLSPPLLAAWRDLMAALPDSRLILKSRNAYRCPVLRRDLEAALELAPGRIDFRSGTDRQEDHLAAYRAVDLALDTQPFSGSTTSFEALWMGVPVLSWTGDRMAGRWTASMLRRLGLEELIAADATDYVARGIALAGDAARLLQLRSGLRERLAASPMTDAGLRARQLERLYRALWQRYCCSTGA